MNRIEVAKLGRPSVAVTLAEGATVRDALAAAGITLAEGEHIEVIEAASGNERDAELDQPVANGDTVYITAEVKNG